MAGSRWRRGRPVPVIQVLGAPVPSYGPHGKGRLGTVGVSDTEVQTDRRFPLKRRIDFRSRYRIVSGPKNDQKMPFG